MGKMSFLANYNIYRSPGWIAFVFDSAIQPGPNEMPLRALLSLSFNSDCRPEEKGCQQPSQIRSITGRIIDPYQ
jgi:hypothetical protein